MAPIIRHATIHDQEGINRIAAEVTAFHARALPDRFLEEPNPFPVERFRELTESDTGAVFVAELDGEIAGHLLVQVRETPPHPIVRPRRFALIDEIGVASTHRRQGIGRLLVGEAVAWAREKGASAVELNVYQFNEEAIAFYKRMGFGTFARRMERPLGYAPEDDIGER